MILNPISSESAASFKAVRLAALQDTPTAFGSTYAKESQFSDVDWQQRVAQWSGDRSICYLAWDEDQPCGIAAGFVDRDDPTKAHLVSMWVAPSYRGSGIGRMLVESIINWARAQRAGTLTLTVTSNNDAATRFYERIGFRKTGNTQPYRNDPTLMEFEMIRTIGQAGGTAAG